MHQYDDPTGTPVQPAPTAPGTPGFYRDGDIGLGTPSAIVRAEHLNAMQMEILNALDAAGITPDKSDYTQLAAAIQAIATTVAGGAAGTTGDIKMRADSAVPAGWLECDGASVLRATYAALFAAIGTTYGSVDGTHFNLPDLRGEFVRGWDNGRGVDAARTLGSTQADALEAHTHTAGFVDPEGRSDGGINNVVPANGGGFSTFDTGSTGSTETRPRNVAVMFVIKT